MTFAQKLRQLRDAAGLSETALAEKAGLTFGAVHGYGLEGQGFRMPSLPAAVRMANALGVSVEVFASCSDVKHGRDGKKQGNK